MKLITCIIWRRGLPLGILLRYNDCSMLKNTMKTKDNYRAYTEAHSQAWFVLIDTIKVTNRNSISSKDRGGVGSVSHFHGSFRNCRNTTRIRGSSARYGGFSSTSSNECVSAWIPICNIELWLYDWVYAIIVWTY